MILNADDGKIIATLPIGTGVDGAVFNPATMEAFSSQGDGTLTVIKENSPTSFVVAQNVETKPSAKTLTLDSQDEPDSADRRGLQRPPPTPPPAGGRGGRGQMVPDSFAILVVGK